MDVTPVFTNIYAYLSVQRNPSSKSTGVLASAAESRRCGLVSGRGFPEHDASIPIQRYLHKAVFLMQCHLHGPEVTNCLKHQLLLFVLFKTDFERYFRVLATHFTRYFCQPDY